MKRTGLLFTSILLIGSLVLLGLFAWYYINFKCLAPYDEIKVTTCLSGSMEPTINVGAWVYTDWSVPFEDIEVGDIILFRTPSECNLDKLVQHRVYAINEKTTEDGVTYTELRTSGDAQCPDDIGITETGDYTGYQAKYLGKVVKIDNSKKDLVKLFYGEKKEDDAREKSIITYLGVLILVVILTSIILVKSTKKTITKK